MCTTDTLVHPIDDEDDAIALVRSSQAIGQFEVSSDVTAAGWIFATRSLGRTARLVNHFLRTGFEMFRRRWRAVCAEKAENSRRLAVSGGRRDVASSATSTCSATCSGRWRRVGAAARRSTTATWSTRSWTPRTGRGESRSWEPVELSSGGAVDPADREESGDVRGADRDQARAAARRPSKADPQGPGHRRLHGAGSSRGRTRRGERGSAGNDSSGDARPAWDDLRLGRARVPKRALGSTH